MTSGRFLGRFTKINEEELGEKKKWTSILFAFLANLTSRLWMRQSSNIPANQSGQTTQVQMIIERVNINYVIFQPKSHVNESSFFAETCEKWDVKKDAQMTNLKTRVSLENTAKKWPKKKK